MKKVYPEDTAQVNDQMPQSVNVHGRRHDLPDPNTLINRLHLHPALARRKDVSKGAREMFAWIEALWLVHRRNDPTTAWLAAATGDSDRQAARYLAELEDLGIIRVLGDGHNRHIRVAENMGVSKDGNHDKSDMVANGNHDKSDRDADDNHDGNGNVPAGNHAKNGRDSRACVGFSEYQKEFKETESTQSRNFRNSISDAERQKAQETWEIFRVHKANGSLKEFEGLLLRCLGRRDCFDLGVLSARKAQDAKKLGAPIALIRNVIDKHLPKDKDAVLSLLDEMTRSYETPAQRREIDARERRLAAEKTANQAPPPARVEAFLHGATKPMPDSNDAHTRINTLTAFAQSEVKHIANRLAREVNPNVAWRSYGDPERQALVQSLLPRALGEWDQEQAKKQKPLSREELHAAIKNGKFV